ncbi:hypothetical protein GGS21DRAFT_519724 [Xylaria nigripes]|nr:hypothetical protein GGS21DRAFT_519724 [Xylaria nigripes]
MAKRTSIAIRALIVSLKSPLGGRSTAEIAEITGVSVSQINRIYAKAIDRGFDPTRFPLTLDDEWLQDIPGGGRPRKQTDENNSSSQSAIEASWSWMKKHATPKGGPKNRREAMERWERTWHHDLREAQINTWIERVPQHVEMIIRLDGNDCNDGKLNSGSKRPRGRPPKTSISQLPSLNA